MFYLFLIILVLAGVALAISTVLGFFSTGAGRVRNDLNQANQRLNIAQAALLDIASGDTTPVLRAHDALAKITQSYSKENK